MNTVTGLIGIGGIWLTMAMVPLVELLGLSATEATFLRGLSGVVVLGIASLFVRNLITTPDRQTLRIVCLFVLATLFLFQAVTAWGANFSALFLDMALFVPLYFLWRHGQTISRGTVMAIAGALLGTLMTLRIFSGELISMAGLFFSLAALVCNGLFIQYAPQARQDNWNKTFWMSVGLCMAAFPGMIQGVSFSSETLSVTFIIIAVTFSLGTGVLNFYSVFTAVKNLSPVTVGVLVLGVTPTIMISSYFLLGKELGWDQIAGVALTLGSLLMYGQTLRPRRG